MWSRRPATATRSWSFWAWLLSISSFWAFSSTWSKKQKSPAIGDKLVFWLFIDFSQETKTLSCFKTLESTWMTFWCTWKDFRGQKTWLTRPVAWPMACPTSRPTWTISCSSRRRKRTRQWPTRAQAFLSSWPRWPKTSSRKPKRSTSLCRAERSHKPRQLLASHRSSGSILEDEDSTSLRVSSTTTIHLSSSLFACQDELEMNVRNFLAFTLLEPLSTVLTISSQSQDWFARDGDLFDPIYSYIVLGKVTNMPSKKEQLAQLAEEAKYYRLNELSQLLNANKQNGEGLSKQKQQRTGFVRRLLNKLANIF